MNGKIAIVVGLVWMLLIVACTPKEKEVRVRFSTTQETMFKNGDVIITTEIRECEDYQKDLFAYPYKLIYSTEVITTMDSLNFHKTTEWDKLIDHIDYLIKEDK